MTRLRERWDRLSFEDRAVYGGLFGFWLVILLLLIAIYTGRWP